MVAATALVQWNVVPVTTVAVPSELDRLPDFRQAYGWAESLLILSLALALVSMALIQLAKDLTRVRGFFQHSQIRLWFGADGDAALERLASPSLPLLETAREKRKVNVPGALYDLPIEQLCGQLSAAMQVALDHPGAHRKLLRDLGIDEEDISLLAGPVPEVNSGPDEQRLAIRNRMDFQLQRTIDAFQIAVGARWKRCLQLSAISLSFLTALTLAAFGPSKLAWSDVGVSAAGAVVGGFLAPALHDLLSGLRRWGRRRE